MHVFPYHPPSLNEIMKNSHCLCLYTFTNINKQSYYLKWLDAFFGSSQCHVQMYDYLQLLSTIVYVFKKKISSSCKHLGQLRRKP
jgi:hypothetical protein